MVISCSFVVVKLCAESSRISSNAHLSCCSVVTLVGDLKFGIYKVLVLSNNRFLTPGMLACKQAIFISLYTVEYFFKWNAVCDFICT